jgi:hypothetical protein
MVTALRRGDSVVVQGFRDRGAELATLRSKIDEINLSKGSHWQMVLIEESATHTYQSGPQSAKSGAAAFLEELSERYTQSPAFNKQQRNGEQDGALAFVSLDRDGKNRMLMLWAHDYFDSRDAGEKSDAFKKEIFPRVTSIIRDKGQLGEGMLTLVQELEKAAALNQSHSERNQKIVLYVIGGVVVIGVGALLISTLCSSRRRGFGSSSNSSGGSFFYFGDGGGGGCGGSSCGGGGGCDGGGF